MAQEIVEGEPPYMDESALKALYLIASQGRAPFKHPERLSPSFKNFVKQCTIMDPTIRPSATQLLKVRYLREDRTRERIREGENQRECEGEGEGRVRRESEKRV